MRRFPMMLATAFACVLLGTPSSRAQDMEPAAEACDACCECDDCCKLWGVIAPSDHCFDDFISPMTNPVFFEDPRTLTEVRFIFAQHNLPPALGNGDVQVVAAQIRAALTDRLSLVAAKDGFIFTGDDFVTEDGWADVAIGLKYNLLVDPECGRIVSAGFHYEMPVGSLVALQGNGDGEFNMYLTGGMAVGECSHLLSTVGLRLPADPNEESSSFYWSVHADRQLTCSGLYGLVEFNWYHWIEGGDNTTFPGLEGLDFYNLGSVGVDGQNIVTGALGAKYKPHGCTEIGLAFEFPLTLERDIIDNRITADWIVRY